MTEPALDPLVQRAILNNDVAYEVLSCDPDLPIQAAFCAHHGAGRVVMGGGNRSSKLLLDPNEFTKLPKSSSSTMASPSPSRLSAQPGSAVGLVVT